MESSVRGEPEDPTKGVDSFLDGANMSLASFEPSLHIPRASQDALDSPSPTNKLLDLPAFETLNELETRTPPLTIADLAAPANKHAKAEEAPDSSPLARQTVINPRPAPIVRKRPSQRALSFQITEDNDKLVVPHNVNPDSDIEEVAGDTTKENEGNDTINSLPFPPTVQRRSSKTLSAFRPASPSKSSMFQTPANIRSTMNRLPTETAMSQRIRDVEVPPSVMKELEQDKRLLGINERNDKSGALTLREQGAVIDKLRKENFGLKIKVFYLEGKINQQYDEASRDVMREVMHFTILLT
jgi:hypothetical protein